MLYAKNSDVAPYYRMAQAVIIVIMKGKQGHYWPNLFFFLLSVFLGLGSGRLQLLLGLRFSVRSGVTESKHKLLRSRARAKVLARTAEEFCQDVSSLNYFSQKPYYVVTKNFRARKDLRGSIQKFWKAWTRKKILH